MLGASTDKPAFAKLFGIGVQRGKLCQRRCFLPNGSFVRPIVFIKPKQFIFLNAFRRQNVHFIASCVLGCCLVTINFSNCFSHDKHKVFRAMLNIGLRCFVFGYMTVLIAFTCVLVQPVARLATILV